MSLFENDELGSDELEKRFLDELLQYTKDRYKDQYFKRFLSLSKFFVDKRVISGKSLNVFKDSI